MAKKILDKRKFTNLRKDAAARALHGASRPANAGSRPSVRMPSSHVPGAPRLRVLPRDPLATIAPPPPPVLRAAGEGGGEASLRDRIETVEDQVNSFVALLVTRIERLEAQVQRIDDWTEPARAVAGSFADRIEAIEKKIGISAPPSDPQPATTAKAG